MSGFFSSRSLLPNAASPTLREQLKIEQKRVKSRALDLMNAAIALEHDLTLVTRNVEDCQDIPGLELYPLTA